MCRAPRPLTVKESAVSPGSTRSARLRSNSRSSLSLRFLVVTYLPSLPAKGEVLTRKFMRTVGSSTWPPKSRVAVPAETEAPCRDSERG